MADDPHGIEAPAGRDAGEVEKEALIAAYKRLLQAFLDRRPSGTRQKLAHALKTHKSFISQITNPAYSVPLPETHVETIMKICHFTVEERQEFLDAYAAAHPRRSKALAKRPRRQAGPTRKLTIDVPVFADPKVQEEVERLITAMAKQVITFARRSKL